MDAFNILKNKFYVIDENEVDPVVVGIKTDHGIELRFDFSEDILFVVEYEGEKNPKWFGLPNDDMHAHACRYDGHFIPHAEVYRQSKIFLENWLDDNPYEKRFDTVEYEPYYGV